MLGDVLGKGLRIYGRNLPAFLLLSTIVFTPLILYVIVAPNPLAGAVSIEDASDGMMEYALLIGLGGMLLQFVLAGAVTWGVVEELGGREVTIVECLRIGLARIVPTLAVSLAMFLGIMLGVLALIVGAFVVMCMLYVAVPASVIERGGVRASLERSVQLTKGYRWWILLLFVIVGFGTGAIGSFLEQIVVRHDDNGNVIPDDFKTWAILQVAIQVAIAPLQSTLAATSYVFLKAAKDRLSSAP